MATEIPTEALEAATRELASRVKQINHGQLCPVWTKKAPVDRCDCWILKRARTDAEITVAAAAVVLLQLGWSPPDGPHVYLSSACRHAVEPGREGEDLHRRCQHDTLRYDGTHKIAAQCKDCGAPCICTCHQEATDGTT